MHTVISAFDDRAAAQAAIDRLMQSGFDRQDIHLEHRDNTAAAGQIGMTREQWAGQEREIAVDRGALRSFGAFFASLLGMDDPSGHVDTYADHVERGNYVLVLDAPDEVQARRAHSVLGDLGGVDGNVLATGERPPLRDILAQRQMDNTPRDLPTGGVLGGERQYERERATAAGNTADDLSHVGLRYADKDEGKPR
jgi:hypothetical protein